MGLAQRASERFLVLARPAYPLPADADWLGTDAYMRSLEREYNAHAYRVPGGGYALVIETASHDALRMVLDGIPLNKARQVSIDVLPLSTI